MDARLKALRNRQATGSPEPDAMYDSDMTEYVGEGKHEVEANIATMKWWAAEGK